MSLSVRDALLRPLAFFRVIGHAPTLAEWIANAEACGTRPYEATFTIDGLRNEIAEMIERGEIVERMGRFQFATDDASAIDRQRDSELWMPRKLRVARRVARWLARLSSVRFVALCNTTAMGHARDEGDLDFFIIVRRGAIMQTRALAALPFKLMHRRPGEGERDAVCLSYFVTDDGLDLSTHMLASDDPYYRYWFLSLLPLCDDGVSQQLWGANRAITSRHPFARPWILSPDLRIDTPRIRIPVLKSLESAAASLQQRSFPKEIRERMNRDTRVIVTDKALKFHVEDRREEYRQRYEDVCREKGVEL